MSGRRKALVVAVDEYEDPGLRRLRSPAADAEALAAVLGDPAVAEFEVEVSRNEEAYQVQARIDDLFAEARADDVVLLHFSGHGLKNEAGELYLAARTTKPGRLASTAVAAEFVQRCMRDSASRSIVLLLDCCYGGAFGEGVAVRAAGDVRVADSFPTGRLGGGRGRAVISASNAMEYAFEGGRLRADSLPEPSPFTAALVRGLATGEADRDEDGWVSLNELYDYVFDRVRAGNPNQTPTRDIEMQGELYLARSTRKRIDAAPLPRDLQAALDDANAYTRLGAVAELRSRLLSANLPVAAGARAALVRVAEADTRLVAESAVEALRQLQLSVTPSAIAFGPLPPGAPSAPQRVEPVGPPLARAANARSSQDWIRVSVVDGGFDVVVVPPGPGPAEGSVTLTAADLTVVVPVTVVGAVPARPPDAVSVGAPGPSQHQGPRIEQQPVEREPVEREPVVVKSVVAPDRPVEHEPAEREREPVEHEPVEHEPVEGSSGRARLVGVMSLIGAAPLAVALLVQGFVAQDLPTLVYAVHPAALVVAGVLLVLTRRRSFALGVAVAAGLAASWPMAIFIALLAGDVSAVDRTVAWLGFAATALCFLAGLAAATLVSGAGLLRVRPGEVALPARLLVGVVAVAAAAALLANAVRFAGHDLGSWAWFAAPFFWYPVLALVLPLAAAFVPQREVRSGLRFGWIAAAVPFHVLFFATAVEVDTTNYTYAGLIAYAVLLPVLIAATIWRPSSR